MQQRRRQRQSNNNKINNINTDQQDQHQQNQQPHNQQQQQKKREEKRSTSSLIICQDHQKDHRSLFVEIHRRDLTEKGGEGTHALIKESRAMAATGDHCSSFVKITKVDVVVHG